MLGGGDKALAKSDLFRTSYLETLAVLNRFNEITGLYQAFVSTRVQPCITAAHDFNVELAAFQIGAIDIGNFQLSASRRLQVADDIDDLIVVKIEAGNRIIALGVRGLFFQRRNPIMSIKSYYAVTLGILYVICKYCRPVLPFHGALQLQVQIVAVEYVISQHQRAWTTSDEIFPYGKSMSQPIRAVLHGILQIEPPIISIT